MGGGVGTREVGARRRLNPVLPPPSLSSHSGAARLLDAALGPSDAPRIAAASAAEAGAAGAAGAAPPLYVAAAAQVRADMSAIRTRMAELKALHGRAALTSFDDTAGRDAEVDAATRGVTAAFRAAEARLVAVGALAVGVPARAGAPADDRVQANVRRTLAAELQALSLAFRKQQKEYLSKLQREKGGGGGGGAHAWDDLLDGAGREASVDSETASPTLAATTARAAAERDRDVAAVVQSIHDLGAIVKDLGVLVIEQGTVLDRIDHNIETVATRVADGARQLARAEKSQRAGRMVMIIMLLAALVVLMLLIVVLRALF